MKPAVCPFWHTHNHLLTMSLFALTIILALGNRTQKDRHLRRPPRPMSWPFIGNLLHVGDQIHISMTNMRDKYGDVFQMRMGSIVVVVLSAYETLRQALVQYVKERASQGDLSSFHFRLWPMGPKICKNALRNVSQAEAKSSTFSCLLEEHVCCEASETVDRLKEHSNCESGFDATIALITSVANVVCALSFGKRYSYNDEEFLNIVQINNEVLRIFAAGNLADFFPIFRYFPSPSLKKMVHHIRKINGFMEQNFKDHLRTYDKNCIRDITDPLIALCEDREDGKKFTLSNTQIVHTVIVITRTKCFDTIIAGLQWSLLYLIKFPDIQSKIYKEIGTAFSDIISHITFAQNFTFPLILGIKQKYSHIIHLRSLKNHFWGQNDCPGFQLHYKKPPKNTCYCLFKYFTEKAGEAPYMCFSCTIFVFPPLNIYNHTSSSTGCPDFNFRMI
uniref:Cytochrome P450 1A n=1 Tax=Paramormyrops kingsleyae TaxID=1676925 RepID=A0A3B3R3D5_9TELE